MALVNNILFENWTAEQVSEWSKGLDDALLPYSNLFLENDLNGQKLMMLTHYDLEKIGITKLGHQELMLEAVDLLKALRYSYDTENLQHLSLQLGCKARSLYNDIQPKGGENDPNKANNSSHGPRRLSIHILAAVADLIMTLKNMVSWLDRAPFGSIYDMGLLRNTIVKIGMDLITTCQKDGTESDVEDNIVKCCHMLADNCEYLTLSNTESLMFQPASLELATIRKKPGEELGMHIQSAYYGVHVIGSIKDMSPADLCRKIEKGDEVIQVNNKTVVGWQLKKLVNTLKEKPKEVILLLKKRPQHMNPFGQNNNRKKPLKNLHAQQVSTLPKKKRASREGEHAKPVRPSLQEFVSSIPTEELYSPKEERTSDEKDDGNDTDNDVFRSGSESPQYTLPVVVDPKQRRATVSGGSPTFPRPLLVIDDLDTPTRPKSFTLTSDAPKTYLQGEDTLQKLNGAPKGSSNGLKRQDNKATKCSPQSLEFTVKKPVPRVQEQSDRGFQDYTSQGKDLLEVPSQFQNPNIVAFESSTDDAIEDVTPPGNEETTDATMGSHNTYSCETKTEESDQDPTAKPESLPDKPKENLTYEMPPVSQEDRLNASVTETSIPNSQLTSLQSEHDDDSHCGSDYEAPDPVETQSPQKIRKNLGGKSVTFGGNTPPESTVSYKTIVVGGVVQKIPIESGSSTPSDSPVVMRKKKVNKKVNRRVSCKDLGQGDCQGLLYKRKQKQGFMSSHWLKRWCVLKQYNLFFFKSKEDLKAEGVLHLPAFQVSPASDITKKKFAFKVHNAGTTFIFAAESQSDMSKWMNKMGLAAISFSPPRVAKLSGSPKHSPGKNDDYYSESEDDDIDGKELVKRSPSSGSNTSISSFTSTPEKELAMKGQSVEDLTSLMRSIEKENLTLTGQNKQNQRRSAMTGGAQGTDDTLPQEQVNKIKKMTSLKRTLKAKEQELDELEKLLTEKFRPKNLHVQDTSL